MSDADDPADRTNREDAARFDPERQREAVERMIAQRREAELIESPQLSSPWLSAIGPCYTAHRIGKATGMTAAEVAAATAHLDLLAVTASDDVVLYPTFQVVDGAAVAGLGVILRTLRTGTDSALMWAQWLRSSPPPLDHMSTHPSPIERLIAGDVDGVVLAAAHTAWAWRG